MRGGRGGKRAERNVSKVNLISRAPLHVGGDGAARRGGRGGEPHFDVKRSAPGAAARHGARRVIVITSPGTVSNYRGGKPEVAACDTEAGERRITEMTPMRVAGERAPFSSDIALSRIRCYPLPPTPSSPLNAFIG